MYNAQIIKLGPPVRPAEPKKERQRKKPDSGKLAIHRDHTRRRIQLPFGMVGGPQVVFLSFIKISSLVSELWGVENCPFQSYWPVAYTPPCTTVQAIYTVSQKTTTFYFFK